MNQLQSAVWTRLTTALLILYWIALVTSTHVPRLPVDLPGNGDKVAHFVAYCGLAFLLSWAWTSRRAWLPAGVLFAFGVAACYGIVDELTQLLVTGRSAEVADWLADISGAAIGVSLFWALYGLYRKSRSEAAPLSQESGEV